MPVNINPMYFGFPYKKIETTGKGATIEVHLPKYIGFGQSDILGFNPAKITTHNFTRAVQNVIEKMKQKPDAVYGHFVTPAGITASRIGRKYDIPSFMAYGEASLNTIKHFGHKETAKELATLDGVIAVSEKNKNMLISADVVRSNIIEVFPNGYRQERFYPRDKRQSRKKFDLPLDKFIVSFVGSFDHRKGIIRLIDAVEMLDDVYIICAGKGKLVPHSKKCLFQGSVKNEDLPFFYSASDVFVLPTLNEGCCNAIIEAMACGLPIISSYFPFNDGLLDETNSLRINPLDINEIRSSIHKIYSNKKIRQELQKGSMEKSKSFTLESRAKKITGYIGERAECFAQGKNRGCY